MEHFKPKGDRARWRELYDVLKHLCAGDTFTFDLMGEALDLDPVQDREKIRPALYRAARELEEKDKRAMAPVPGVGYRVVAVEEQLTLARKQQKRSARALVRGQSKVVNVDLNGVDPDTRRKFEVVGHIFARQMDFNRRVEESLTDHHRTLESLKITTERTVEQTEVLERSLTTRMERLEAKMRQMRGEAT